MIAARAAGLLLCAVAIVAALESGGTEGAPSSSRVVVTAVTGLLALWLWPGPAPTAVRTTLRVIGWSALAAAVAAVLLAVQGPPARPWTALGTSCLMLLSMLLPALSLVALFQGRRPHRSPFALNGAVMLAFVVAASAPLWLGPAAELAAQQRPALLDLLLAASPLTHLAVAADNDLLRNEWLYRHANLASLPVSYPTAAAPMAAYALCGALGLALLWRPPAFARAAPEPSPHPDTETAP